MHCLLSYYNMNSLPISFTMHHLPRSSLPVISRLTGARAARFCGLTAHALTRESMETTGRQLYEQCWSHGDMKLLESIMAEDHTQNDVIWNQGVLVTGREKMSRGIRGFRIAYPDIEYSVLSATADPSISKVFVQWVATGTNTRPVFGNPPTRKRMTIGGCSVLTLDAEGRIARSDVYRQATPEEASPFLRQPGSETKAQDGEHGEGGAGAATSVSAHEKE